MFDGLENNIKAMIRDEVNRQISIFRQQVQIEFYPEKLRSKQACQMLGITLKALNKRLSDGWYAGGIHYEKKSDRIYLWSRDALLEIEKLKGRKK